MDREKLHKFFEGEATPEEKKVIKLWLEESTDHKQELYKEREFFDALILSDKNRASRSLTKPGREFSLRKVLTEIGKVAAIAAILIVTGLSLYNKKMEDIRMATNTIVVPAGQRANIQLPDGTNVWLNARSELTYPAYFTGVTREIQLNGEAYFEVVHNKKQPFIVHTQQYDIEVLGTAFNVDAYSYSEDFSTALMNGAVKVTNRNNHLEKIDLSPQQMVRKSNGILVADRIEDFDIYRWREGLICFKNTEFIELMKRFEKCYGIEIIVENPKVINKIFSGKFRISDGIDSALRVLQKEGEYKFERNSDESIVYIR